MADPPFEAGFALWDAGLAASRKWSRARSGFRAQRERATSFWKPQARPAPERGQSLPDEDDLHGMRSKSDAELEVIAGDLTSRRYGPARAELNLRQREHERDVTDRQMQAAN